MSPLRSCDGRARQRAAKVGLVEPVALDHRAHRAVQDQDALVEEAASSAVRSGCMAGDRGESAALNSSIGLVTRLRGPSGYGADCLGVAARAVPDATSAHVLNWRHETLQTQGSARVPAARRHQAVFIDCRSEMEFFFVGHPVGAQHVAWNDGPDWEINPHFVGQVKKVASMNRPIVLICRSGHRSVDAGLALEKAGFADIYNVLDGFEGPLDEKHHRGTLSGWRKEGLPWEQS